MSISTWLTSVIRTARATTPRALTPARATRVFSGTERTVLNLMNVLLGLITVILMPAVQTPKALSTALAIKDTPVMESHVEISTSVSPLHLHPITAILLTIVTMTLIVLIRRVHSFALVIRDTQAMESRVLILMSAIQLHLR